MPWNLVSNPWVSWSFYKTTIIRQLTNLLTAGSLLFCKNSMKPKGWRLNSMALNI